MRRCRKRRQGDDRLAGQLIETTAHKYNTNTSLHSPQIQYKKNNTNTNLHCPQIQYKKNNTNTSLHCPQIQHKNNTNTTNTIQMPCRNTGPTAQYKYTARKYITNTDPQGANTIRIHCLQMLYSEIIGTDMYNVHCTLYSQSIDKTIRPDN